MQLSRRDLMIATGSGLALSALPACARQEKAPDAKALLETLAEEYLRLSPESATGLGIDTGKRAALKSQLSDRSQAGRDREAAWLKDALRRLDTIEMDDIDPSTRVDVEVARTAYSTASDGYAYPYGAVEIGGWRNGPYVVAQNMGAYIDVPRFLDASHKVENKNDADAYLARLEAFASELDGETERLKSARGQGVVASQVLMAKTLQGIRMSRGGEPKDWLIVTSLADRTGEIPGDWRARAEQIARASIAPALDRQIAELEEHAKAATHDAGIWKLKDGADYYAWALRASTTTRMTPDEVHAMGQSELRRLQAEMDTILKQLGYTDGSVGQRMIALAKDPRYTFPNDDTGRKQIMDFIQATLADIRTRLPRAFGTLVEGRVEVRRIAPAEEGGAPGAYGGAGSIDGTVPGRFWINLRTTDLHTKYSLPTLTYHESIPGHVWQGEYAHKLSLIRSLMSFNAFSEGWALYAEQLAGELGVYDDNPVGRLGYLQSIAFRACRLVVDTGLHAKRWTRDQAIRWFAETNGSGLDEVTSEVDRYCAWPGQACGYKVGHSEINRLRTQSQQRLGERYDFRGYNDVVVGGGGVPLNVLAGNVERWEASRRG